MSKKHNKSKHNKKSENFSMGSNPIILSPEDKIITDMDSQIFEEISREHMEKSSSDLQPEDDDNILVPILYALDPNISISNDFKIDLKSLCEKEPKRYIVTVYEINEFPVTQKIINVIYISEANRKKKVNTKPLRKFCEK